MIAELAGRHEGDDVWVIASGASMNHVAPDFFDGRVVVGVNDVWTRYPLTYCVRKEHDGAQLAIDSGVPLVVSRGDKGNSGTAPPLTGPHWVFEHRTNADAGHIDLTAIGDGDILVVSWSTITSAIHFAAFLGARAVIVAGHDCGTIDGAKNFDGYGAASYDGFNEGEYCNWLARIEHQTMQVCQRVTEVYGCPVVGLNPWPSLALDGHVHSGRR